MIELKCYYDQDSYLPDVEVDKIMDIPIWWKEMALFFSHSTFVRHKVSIFPCLGSNTQLELTGKTSEIIFYPHSGGKYILTHFDALFSQAYV